MEQNLFEAKYDITRKSKLSKFYNTNKKLIFSSVASLIILISVIIFFFEYNESKRTKLSEKYVQAKILITKNELEKSSQILKEVIYSNDKTYSPLSLFVIINNDLVNENNELIKLIDYVIENNNFEKEVKNLIIYKKALLLSQSVEGSKLLSDIRPLITSDTIWKPHALFLMGDYYFSKKQYSNAKEFYSQILSIKNLRKNFYDQATSQLNLINNE